MWSRLSKREFEREAAGIRRELAAQNPAAYRPDLVQVGLNGRFRCCGLRIRRGLSADFHLLRAKPGARMIPELTGGNESEGEDGSLAVLTVLALFVGAVSGAVVAVFIVLLERADRFRNALIVWAHAQGTAGFWPGPGLHLAAAGAAASLGAPDLASVGRQWHSACRGRPERAIAAGPRSA